MPADRELESPGRWCAPPSLFTPAAAVFVLMWQSLITVINSLFVGPIWPATVLLLLVLAYLLISIVAALDFDALGMEVDADINAHPWQSLGGFTLRWLHLDTIPLVIWLGCFAVIHWLIAYIMWYAFDAGRYEATLGTSTLLTFRNGTFALLVTKLATAPLTRFMGRSLAYEDQALVGRTAVVSTTAATPEFGQAKFDTGGAPLLLNIRTDGPHARKGDRVTIVAYEPQKRLYIVTPLAEHSTTTIPSESQS